jgi:hypothetical protein
VSTIRHLVWHDIRALRLPLVAWLLILLVQAAVMALGPGLIDPEARGGGVQSFARFLAGARLAFTILLTVLFIQRDSSVGTTAFWMTRPIQPAAMAASKLTSAVLFLVALPAVVGWSLFTALGLPALDLRDGIWPLVLEQGLIVSLAAMGAAITATIPQFAVAAVAAVLLVGTLTSEIRPYVEGPPWMRIPFTQAPLVAWVSVTVLGTIGVIAYQYSRRRAVRAAAAVTGVLVIGALSALTVRASVDPSSIAPLVAGVLDPGAITVDVDPAAVRAESASTIDRRGRQTRYRHANSILRISGAPPAIVLQPWSIESTWQPEGVPPIRWQRRSAAGYLTRVTREGEDDEQPHRSIAIGLGDVELLRSTRIEATAFRTTLLNLREEEVSRLSSAQGPLDAAVTLRAWRYRVVDAAPLAVGSTVSARQGRLTVQAITRTREGVQVDGRQVFLQRFERAPEDFFGSGIGSSEHVLLRNQSRKQAILLAAESVRQLTYSMLSALASLQFGTGTRRMRFVIPLADEDRVRLDDEWLKGAELVVMRPEDLGVFTRPLRVEWVNLDSAR